MTKSHHVVPSGKGGWSIKKSGDEKASRHFDNKQDAVRYARQVSINQKTELYIHKKDGTIASKDSHGCDPMPPKDKK